jgi:hypothetical protein
MDKVGLGPLEPTEKQEFTIWGTLWQEKSDR